MQQSKSADQSSGSETPAQMINDLRVRVLQAKGGFMKMGSTYYMGFLEVQAAKEGQVLDAARKAALRQVINGNLKLEDAPDVEFIERALTSLKAA